MMSDLTKELVFHLPETGDWLVIEDVVNNKKVYSGHGRSGTIYEVLEYLGVKVKVLEYQDEEYQEKF